MRWLGWLRRTGTAEDAQVREWRQQWTEAAGAPRRDRTHSLRERLEAIAAGLGPDDVEIEREMQEGLEAAVELSEAIAATGPPVIVTGHRAIGGDRCHFSASGSLPDEASQPSGTVLLTNARLVFVGGARALTVPWHAVSDAPRQDRDLLLIRADTGELQRVRFNTYVDALCAHTLAGHLRRRRV
jgi:hypothetical protein